MIFCENLVRTADKSGSKVVSYGLSSYGYDIRVSDEFKVFTNVYNSIINPKDFRSDSFVEIKKDVCIVCLQDLVF